jgi:hypothetical protein
MPRKSPPRRGGIFTNGNVTSPFQAEPAQEEIRESLRRFIDTGFTAHHDIVEYWDGGPLKVFRGIVTMTPDNKSKPVVKNQ